MTLSFNTINHLVAPSPVFWYNMSPESSSYIAADEGRRFPSLALQWQRLTSDFLIPCLVPPVILWR